MPVLAVALYEIVVLGGLGDNFHRLVLREDPYIGGYALKGYIGVLLLTLTHS